MRKLPSDHAAISQLRFYKVFAHVLPSKIDPLLRSKRRFEQSGFTSGRSTLDAILALQLLSEVHREFSQPLHVAFVDLKAAFDSVDRLALWRNWNPAVLTPAN